jgi:hypothetical protein
VMVGFGACAGASVNVMPSTVRKCSSADQF